GGTHGGRGGGSSRTVLFSITGRSGRGNWSWCPAIATRLHGRHDSSDGRSGVGWRLLCLPTTSPARPGGRGPHCRRVCVRCLLQLLSCRSHLHCLARPGSCSYLERDR